ncbi:MAG: hypothetical protein H6600_02125 [Flavobacteriales bacterium]|nr:hypothetical protein [Flavobacteriales bacterium]MCB9197228.1 hypothetical protein [Flavobacteriales bacterium]
MENEILDQGISTSTELKELSFPISFTFKIGTFANDFEATDAGGNTIAYVRQKMFKFKEAVKVYNNKSKSNILFEINADRIIDFNASYNFTDADGNSLGKIGRKGMKSLWKASYEIFDENGIMQFHIKEENPWAKVFDAMLCEIPLLAIFSGYLFNPKYLVTSLDGGQVARISKEKSFFGRRFKLNKLSENLEADDQERVMLALMMMLLLERRRG